MSTSDDKPAGADAGAAAAADAPAKEKSLLEMGDDAPAGDPAKGDPAKDGQAGDGPQPYYPDGIEDGLKGKTDKDTIDALFARQKGLRDQLAKKGGAAPEKPEDYDLSAVAKEFGDAADEANPVNQPVFKILREAFHKAGLGQETFAGITGQVLKAMKEGGLLEAADPMAGARVSAEKELGEMASMFGGRDQALKIVRDERQYLQNMQQAGIIDGDDHAELLVAMGTAKGLRAFQKIRAHFTGHELPQLEQSAETRETLDQIKLRWKDPRFVSDPAFRAQAERDLAAAQAGKRPA